MCQNVFRVLFLTILKVNCKHNWTAFHSSLSRFNIYRTKDNLEVKSFRETFNKRKSFSCHSRTWLWSDSAIQSMNESWLTHGDSFGGWSYLALRKSHNIMEMLLNHLCVNEVLGIPVHFELFESSHSPWTVGILNRTLPLLWVQGLSASVVVMDILCTMSCQPNNKSNSASIINLVHNRCKTGAWF